MAISGRLDYRSGPVLPNIGEDNVRSLAPLLALVALAAPNAGLVAASPQASGIIARTASPPNAGERTFVAHFPGWGGSPANDQPAIFQSEPSSRTTNVRLLVSDIFTPF